MRCSSHSVFRLLQSPCLVLLDPLEIGGRIFPRLFNHLFVLRFHSSGSTVGPGILPRLLPQDALLQQNFLVALSRDMIYPHDNVLPTHTSGCQPRQEQGLCSELHQHVLRQDRGGALGGPRILTALLFLPVCHTSVPGGVASSAPISLQGMGMASTWYCSPQDLRPWCF